MFDAAIFVAFLTKIHSLLPLPYLLVTQLPSPPHRSQRLSQQPSSLRVRVSLGTVFYVEFLLCFCSLLYSFHCWRALIPNKKRAIFESSSTTATAASTTTTTTIPSSTTPLDW
jgi:hypothetical protein